MEKEPTTKEILKAIESLSSNTEKSFTSLNSEMTEVKKSISDLSDKTEKSISILNEKVDDLSLELKSEVTDIIEAINLLSTGTDERFEKLENKVDGIDKTIRNQMVSKDYLDDKLTDASGDLTVLIRKEDTKTKTIVANLKKKKVYTEAEEKKYLSMEPFPQLSL